MPTLRFSSAMYCTYRRKMGALQALSVSVINHKGHSAGSIFEGNLDGTAHLWEIVTSTRDNGG
jgi:hypothetical protein